MAFLDDVPKRGATSKPPIPHTTKPSDFDDIFGDNFLGGNGKNSGMDGSFFSNDDLDYVPSQVIASRGSKKDVTRPRGEVVESDLIDNKDDDKVSRRSGSRRGGDRNPQRIGTAAPRTPGFMEQASKTTGNFRPKTMAAKEFGFDDLFGDNAKKKDDTDDLYGGDPIDEGLQRNRSLSRRSGNNTVAGNNRSVDMLKNSRRKDEEDFEDLFGEKGIAFKVADAMQQSPQETPEIEEYKRRDNNKVSPVNPHSQAQIQNTAEIAKYTQKISQLEARIEEYKAELSKERTEKEKLILQSERTKGDLELEIKTQKNIVEELKRSLQITKETSSDNHSTMRQNYESQLKLLEERNSKNLIDIRSDHKEEMKTVRENYVQIIEDLKSKNNELNTQLREKTREESKIGGRLDGFELKMEHMLRQGIPTQPSLEQEELQLNLAKLKEAMQSFKEQQAKIAESERLSQDRLARRAMELDRLEKEIRGREEALRLKESQIDDKLSANIRELDTKDTRLRELQRHLELEREKMREENLRVKKVSAEIADIEATNELKYRRRETELNMLKDEADRLNFDAQRRKKDILEKEKDLAWRTDKLNTDLQNLKISEQRLREEQEELTAVARRLKDQQQEVSHFRNNFINEEQRLASEKQRLSSLELIINTQIDKFNQEKSSLEQQKKTLFSLRSDYVKDLKTKLQREDFLNQELAFTPFTKTSIKEEFYKTTKNGGLGFTGNYDEMARTRETAALNAFDPPNKYMLKKFDYEGFVKGVQSKLNY